MTEGEKLAKVLDSLSVAFTSLAKTLDAAAFVLRIDEGAKPKGAKASQTIEPLAPRVHDADDAAGRGANKTRRKILVALVQLNRPLNKLQIGLYSQLSSGTGPFGVAMAGLKRDGMITQEGGTFRITEAGRAEAGEVAPLPTGGALFEFWCSRMGTTEGKILRALRPHGTELSKPELGPATGLSHSTGPFGVAIARLKRMGLVVGDGRGFQLSPEFRRMLEPTIHVHNTSTGTSVKVDRSGHVKQ